MSSTARTRRASVGSSGPNTSSINDPNTRRALAISRAGSTRCRAPEACTTISAFGNIAARSPTPPAWSRWMCVTTMVRRSPGPTPSAASASRTTGADFAVPVSISAGCSPRMA